jgi:hypothetical protein
MIEKDEIISHTAGGTLHWLILDKYERGRDSDDAAFVNLAVDLHNENTIDLLALLTPSVLEEAKGFHFFTLQQFFCTAIPRLEAGLKPLMLGISSLVKAAGEDLMAYAPNSAYRDWCSVSDKRCVAALTLIEAGDAEAKDYLSLTLEAGAQLDLRSYMARAIAYAREAPDLRMGALTALARIDCSKALDLGGKAFELLLELVGTETDDLIRTHVLAATVGLHSRAPKRFHKRAVALLAKAVELGGDHVLHRSAVALSSEREHLSDEMIEILLTALEHVNPINLGTINTLDGGLSQLVKAGKGSRVSQFLEAAFLARPNALGFKQFDSVGHALTTTGRALAEDMTVRWLMSGDQTLAEHISSLMGGTTREPVLFEVDIKPYALSDIEALFLARKAVGWLFFHPITAASLIICILRSVKGETAEAIGDLLFDPLLLNYSGELCEHLTARVKGSRDRAKPHIRRALAKLDAYLDDLRSVGFLAELRPSERERLIERKQQSERMRQISKQAEQMSVLLSMVSKSLILHGNGSVGYRRGADGKLHRHAMKMGGFSTSFEAPRLTAIDPFGIDMQLRHFRAERLVS